MRHDGFSQHTEITVVIPNLNSPVIDRTLGAIRSQDFDMSRVEVLVVGVDEPRLVVGDDLVKLIPTDGPASPAVARNLGLRCASGEIICLTDADCVPGVAWLSQVTAPIRSGEATVVGGGVRIDAADYWTLADNISWFHDYLTSTDSGERRILPTLNLCVKRDVVQQVGYLDESYPRAAGEDAEWTTRMRLAGHRLHFRPEAWVIHAPPARSGVGAVWRHSYHYGRYSVKLQDEPDGLLDPHALLNSWLLLLLLSPAASLAAALRIFLFNAGLLRYAHTLPGIWVSKMAWILGAIDTLRHRAKSEWGARDGC